MPGKAIVLDANILVRAVLGKRVRQIIEKHAGRVSLFVPDAAFAEAEEHLPRLAAKHGGDPEAVLVFLQQLGRLVQRVGTEVYGDLEAVARERLRSRDPDDWPILASALALDCPIWTEDTDFFGCGVATWTSDRVEAFLRE
jgi:predicted nucleic acid-binding protein